ncbi:MAG: leucine--tRNA ligase [bacterium]
MYNFREIEKKWQEIWEDKTNSLHNQAPKPKYYVLEMFAYPSGDLHMGHFRNYVLGDTIARYRRMQGYEVLHPFGWDAFGLPAEEAAIKKHLAPRDWTMNNIKQSKETINLMGISYDWDKEVCTCEPDYYRWTQWIFIKLYEKGLAYRKASYVNWCPQCQTTLANEQVINGLCWRCKKEVTKKELTQWFFKITEYAERLLKGIDTLSQWSEEVRTLQRYWIGKSEGLEIDFQWQNEKIPVFTTRPDTIYGVTFLAAAPESELAKKLAKTKELQSYIENSLKTSEIERAQKTKSGVFTGEYGINPLTGEKIPIWIADYILGGYGTGLIMGVPAHDERDYEFAISKSLPIKNVIKPIEATEDKLFTGEGIMINSDIFDGMNSKEGITCIVKLAEEKGIGRRKTNYKIKDWLVSRQRYWGAPIPVIHCEKCGIIPVPEKDLPVLLPECMDFTPKGKSPLASVPEFVNTKCPVCNGNALRDTDTMDTFVDSSWYWARYIDSRNEKEAFNKELVKEWLPIDEYIGGIEHACGHLIFFRFMNKVLYDLGYVPFDEPCKRMFTQGMITDEKGMVMSKSKGNAVAVRPFVEDWGADAGRVTILFLGPPNQSAAWSMEGVKGVSRFLERIYKLVEEKIPLANDIPENETPLYRRINFSIKKVGEDIENYGHNTAVSELMTLVNELYKNKEDKWLPYGIKILIQLLSPFAPHLSEELWQKIGNSESVFKSKWPAYKEIKEEMVNIIVEINGKVRENVKMKRDISNEEAEKEIRNIIKIQELLKDKNIIKVIWVPNKLINFVVK